MSIVIRGRTGLGRLVTGPGVHLPLDLPLDPPAVGSFAADRERLRIDLHRVHRVQRRVDLELLLLLGATATFITWLELTALGPTLH
jgi:hypothetical protein